MKIISFIAILGLWLSPTGTTNTNQAEEKFILKATYLGFNDEGYFEFIDAKGKQTSFAMVSDDVTYDLYDEEVINMKFEVTWMYVESDEEEDEGIDLFDSEGDINSMTTTKQSENKVKYILKLKAI